MDTHTDLPDAGVGNRNILQAQYVEESPFGVARQVELRLNENDSRSIPAMS